MKSKTYGNEMRSYVVCRGWNRDFQCEYPRVQLVWVPSLLPFSEYKKRRDDLLAGFFASLLDAEVYASQIRWGHYEDGKIKIDSFVKEEYSGKYAKTCHKYYLPSPSQMKEAQALRDFFARCECSDKCFCLERFATADRVARGIPLWSWYVQKFEELSSVFRELYRHRSLATLTSSIPTPTEPNQ